MNNINFVCWVITATIIILKVNTYSQSDLNIGVLSNEFIESIKIEDDKMLNKKGYTWVPEDPIKEKGLAVAVELTFNSNIKEIAMKDFTIYYMYNGKEKKVTTFGATLVFDPTKDFWILLDERYNKDNASDFELIPYGMTEGTLNTKLLFYPVPVNTDKFSLYYKDKLIIPDILVGS